LKMLSGSGRLAPLNAAKSSYPIKAPPATDHAVTGR
jgi:hypothetical protein